MKDMGVGTGVCRVHGKEHMTWKCMYCCSEALFICGDTFFCEYCHDVERKNEDCGGINCPLGVPHPPIFAKGSNTIIKRPFPLYCSACTSSDDRKHTVQAINDFSAFRDENQWTSLVGKGHIEGQKRNWAEERVMAREEKLREERNRAANEAKEKAAKIKENLKKLENARKATMRTTAALVLANKPAVAPKPE